MKQFGSSIVVLEANEFGQRSYVDYDGYTILTDHGHNRYKFESIRAKHLDGLLTIYSENLCGDDGEYAIISDDTLVYWALMTE